MKRILGAVLFLVSFTFASGAEARDAWVILIDRDQDVVGLQVVEAKINLFVRFPNILGELNLRLNDIAGFEFMCAKTPAGGCYTEQSFRVRIKDRVGEVLAWQFLQPLTDIVVGKGRTTYHGAVLRAKMGEQYLMLALAGEEEDALAKAMSFQGAKVLVGLPETTPNQAYLNFVPFRIVGVALLDRKLP